MRTASACSDRLRSTAPAALLAAAAWCAPAQALTPDELWAALRAGVPDGVTLSAGAERKEGETVVLSDVVLSGPTGGGGRYSAAVSEVILAPLPEGRVGVTSTPEVLVTGSDGAAGGSGAEFAGVLRLAGHSLTVGGSPETPEFEAAAASAALDLTVTESGAAVGSIAGTLSDGRFATAGPAPGSDGLRSLTAGIGDLAVTARSTGASDPFDGRIDLRGLVFDAGHTPFAAEEGRGRMTGSIAHFGAALQGSGIGGAFDVDVAIDALAAEADATVGPPPETPRGVPRVDGTARLTIGGLRYDANGPDPTTGQMTEAAGSLRDMSLAADVKVPEAPDGEDVSALLRDGLDLRLSLRGGQSTSSAVITDPALPMEIASQAEPFAAEFAMSKNGALMNLDQGPVSATVTLPGQPGPFEGSYARMLMRFAMPLAPAPGDQPLVLTLRLDDLLLADSAWNLFDPDRLIPRDPASLVVDLGGTLRVTGDPLGPAPDAFEKAIGDARIDLTELRLAFGGAEVTGGGALTVTGSGPAAVPSGKVNLTFRGVYTLLGHLGTLNLLPPDVALAIRGGLAFIGKPSGADLLTSEIEMRPDGTLLANGVPVPLE
jgi:hypothetical protein